MVLRVSELGRKKVVIKEYDAINWDYGGFFFYCYDQRSWSSVDNKITEWVEIKDPRGQCVEGVMVIDIKTTKGWYKISVGDCDNKQRFLRNGYVVVRVLDGRLNIMRFKAEGC